MRRRRGLAWRCPFGAGQVTENWALRTGVLFVCSTLASVLSLRFVQQIASVRFEGSLGSRRDQMFIETVLSKNLFAPVERDISFA
jgi:hypothetical protein